MTDLELISEIRRADNPKALELLRDAVGLSRMEGSREMAERLSEENAQLQVDLSSAEVALANISGAILDSGSVLPAERWRWGDTIRALSEENARLREALERIAAHTHANGRQLTDMARAALAGQQPAQPEGGK